MSKTGNLRELAKNLTIPPHRPRSNSIQTTVGDYILLKTVGHGSFGKVKLGRHIPTKQKVAVKIIDKSSLQDAGDHERLQREITLTKILRHPNIASVYEVLEFDNKLHIVSEYASGGELFDYIVARGRCSEGVARKFFRQMFAGIEYCHKHFIIHRDLKPENLLLDDEQNIKVVDFGFANAFSPGSFLETFCGSPAYAAPEMIAGKPYAGPEVDVWSMGVILYALLCGFLPFDSNNMHELYQLVLQGKYEEPDFLSAGARSLVKRMLVVDSAKRATHDEIRAHPWLQTDQSPLPDYSDMIHQQVHPEMVKLLAEMEYDIGETSAALATGTQNRLTAGYYILLDKLRREGKALPNYTGSPVSLSPSSSPPQTRKRSGSIDNNVTTKESLAVPERSVTPGRVSPGQRYKPAKPSSLNPESKKEKTKGKGKMMFSALMKETKIDSAPAANLAKQAVLTSTVQAVDGDKSPDEPKTGLKNRLQRRAAAGKESRKRSQSVGMQKMNEAKKNGGVLKTAVDRLKVDDLLNSAKNRDRPQSMDARAGAELAAKVREQAKDENLRQVKGAFSADTTTQMAASRVMAVARRVLDASSIEYFRDREHEYLLECADRRSGVKFELEICQLRDITMNGVRLKRLSGDAWAYKQICRRLASQLKL